MQRRIKMLIAGTAVAAAAAAGTGIAIAGGGDDGANDTPITGAELQKASAAALEYTGGGRVTETEKGDEESLYEVEVTRDGGRSIDVQLDENFKVVGSKTESGQDN